MHWRPPGQETYKFLLNWKMERVSKTEDIRELFPQEYERRRKIENGDLMMCLTCIVNGDRIGTTTNMPLYWETWATSNNP